MAGKTLPEIYCWKMKVDELYIYLASSKRGAVKVGLSLERDFDCVTYFKEVFPSTSISEDYLVNRTLVEAVEATLRNRPRTKNLSLDLTCTPFQLMVWKAITQIPFGRTETYGEVAAMIGRPGGARAVGQALGRNPLPLVFP
ncbi:MAG: MGMT family protein [Deltaproteobacteria bacterium]|nr:MAG: MGMT family protein [Deltaproteobacteria bacterium]